MKKLELWGGVECTVNRVRDAFFDQVERTAHAGRLEDLDRIADLGIRTIRYPILWERCVRERGCAPDFTWTDARMERLRALGFRVIVGLVHHGSGPPGYSLVDEGFAGGLLDFARAVATRYPWVEDFTPINEPLTTARFSGLYGHWYPHGRDDATFLRTLLVETNATVSSMRAIREITPSARLIQTEDLGTVFSSPPLRYQVDFENERRWLSLDLLHGRVDPSHPLYDYLLDEGVPARDLDVLRDAPCPSDLVGVNYYVTSDRYLDDRVDLYPGVRPGGNGRDVYVDVEAVRAMERDVVSHRRLLTEVWERYEVPVAITEVHLGCTPEEQIRWLSEAWSGAEAAIEEGVDVRAVTLWSLFGSYDWDSLVTQARGSYEPGAFDVRGPRVRPTAIAKVAKQLIATGTASHPLLTLPGWWRRADRFLTGVPSASVKDQVAPPCPPILIIGADNLVGHALQEACHQRGLPVKTLHTGSSELATEAALFAVFEQLRPWLVIHVGSGLAERGAHAATASVLARACRLREARFLTFSSAFVFDGKKGTPYVETDSLAPKSMVGAYHANAERSVLRELPDALIVRTGTVFGLGQTFHAVHAAFERLQRGERLRVPVDCQISPTYAPDLAHACLDLAMAESAGVIHLTNDAEPLSLAAWLTRLCEALAIDCSAIVPDHQHRLLLGQKMPRQASLASVLTPPLSSLDGALDRHARASRERRDFGSVL